MGWYVEFNKLSPRQRSFLSQVANNQSKTHWSQGFAGTGKTLLLLHLVERMASENNNISQCFITFTHTLVDLVKSSMRKEIRESVDIITHTRFLKNAKKYDYVYVDEVQDISKTDLEQIKNLASHLVIAGDHDQKIYKEGASADCIKSLFDPIEQEFLETFRLTEKLRKVALSILPTAKVVEGIKACNMVEADIRLLHYSDENKQAEDIWNMAEERSRPGSPCVILFPTHDLIKDFSEKLANRLEIPKPPPIPTKKQENRPRDYEPFNDYWKRNDKNLVYLGNGYGNLPDSDHKPIVYIMTFHSSKGLDFRNVFIPGMDPNAMNDTEAARRLLFVAATRSRENLFLSHCGHLHPILEDLPEDEVVKVEIDDKYTITENEEDTFF